MYTVEGLGQLRPEHFAFLFLTFSNARDASTCVGCGELPIIGARGFLVKST